MRDAATQLFRALERHCPPLFRAIDRHCPRLFRAIDRHRPRLFRAIDRHCPPGFGVMGAFAVLLVGIGIAQLAALAIRDEPYPFAAAALALVFACGGAVLVAFVREGTRSSSPSRSRRSPADLVTAAALALFGLGAVAVLWMTGIFFPARMALFWVGNLPGARLAEAPLPMMLAGTCLVGSGAVATAALFGALWLFLYSRHAHGAARLCGAAVSFAGAVPYVAFALVVRAVLCGPVAFLAAGRWLALRPDDQLAYRSLVGMAPGYLCASVALGLCVARGLWSFLEQVRLAEEKTDSFLAATLRGQRPFQIVLRQGLWLRRRRELGGLLLGGFAAAVLVDILSNTLIDSFRPPGFPPYPSLGAALFLRGIGTDGMPAPLDGGIALSHALLVLAALLLLLAQTFPRRLASVALRSGVLRVGPKVLASGVAGPHGLPSRPALQWVLGASGSGKSTLLRAWSRDLPGALLVPQDADDLLPAALSGTDVGRLARCAHQRGDRILWDFLGRLDDARLRRGLFDPFTTASCFSRGERQRLAICLALTRARRDPDCTLLFDEPTSAQDGDRTSALVDCIRELLPAELPGEGSLVLAAHDPESLDALLGDGAVRSVTDHVLWLEDGRAHEFTVHAAPGKGQRWEGATAQPHGLQGYLADMTTLLEAREATSDPGGMRLTERRDAGGMYVPERADPGGASIPERAGPGVRLLRSRLFIGGERYAVSPQAVVRGGELFVLRGASGSGKSTFLRAIATRRPASIEVGYVMQDPGRAFPEEMPVREVLGEVRAVERERVRRWFGGPVPDEMLARSVCALSEGEKQRVLFAGEVLRIERSSSYARLRLLLLDEPFGAVDPSAHLRLMDLLLEWLREGQGRSTAILVSHSPDMDVGLARASGVPVTEWTIDNGDR